MAIQLNSPWWQIRSRSRTGATRRPAGSDLAGLPPAFLTAESTVAEEAVLQAATVRGAAGDGGGALDISCSVEPGYTAVLAVRHPSGALTFSLPAETTSRGARGSSDVRFRVPASRTPTRGAVDKVVKAIVIKVAKAAGDKAVSYLLPRLAEGLEREVWKRRQLREGWVKVSEEALATGTLDARVPVSPRRSLLLLHGSLSHTALTFRPLAESDFFSRVKGTYEDRIFGFDYFSISRSPEDVARLLLESLPEPETTFDAVTHGLGGLVLRNIVERGGQFGALSRRFKLGHAVLVASPNEGTPLVAAQRWDDTLGWIANVLELFPDNPFTTGSALVANGLVWLANHALGDLPGLRAMDPAAESIDALQRPPGPSLSAYSALVANYQPDGAVLHRLLDVGIDQFFSGANDLVVPSEGAWRIDRARNADIPPGRIGCIGPGGNLPSASVTYLGYFSNRSAVDFIVNGLLGQQQPFAPLEPRRALPDRRLLRGATDAPAAGDAPVHAAGRPADRGVERATPERPLQITLINGDLTFESEALLLGHYHATRLTGTEKVMDGLLGGTMSRSLAMGVYPVAAGSHQVFINNRPNLERGTFLPKPKAVIVVGLGEEGKLRATDLAQSVCQAVITWSQRLAEGANPPREFELAATLLGSGGTGVSAGEAARLVADGVYQANLLLSDSAARDGARERERVDGARRGRRRRGARADDDLVGPVFPRVSHLRFIELYLERAVEAWRSLKLQEEATDGRYTVTPQVKPGSGGMTRPPDLGYRGAEYDFIAVEATKDTDGTPLISYKLDTRRARSEVRGQRAQSSLIRELVATGSNDKNNDERIGRTLFNLVVPMEIEAYLAGSGEMQIELDPQTASIPWELLDSGRDSDTPWAIRVKLLRKLRIQQFREQVADAGADGGALVIGEPDCPRDFPRLYGARAEAAAVHATLTREPGGLPAEQVKPLFQTDPMHAGPGAIEVVNALFERPWRIVHIAGHGVLGTDGSPGGVVLSNGAFLGPAEVGNMRTVPELVFVNCCHLGAADTHQMLNTRYDRATFAAGLAGALISMGVRCVIAAGWAVDDEAARVFAEAFYDSLLRGDRFIDAVCHARALTYDHSPSQNTWAAYQAYGDPDWVFQKAPPDANRASSPSFDEFSGIASALSLKFALERITVQTRFQGYARGTQLEKLRQLEASHASSWGARGDVAEAFAAAFDEAGNSDAALRWYESAVAAEDGLATMKAAEQLANVRGRLAWESVDRAMRRVDEIRIRESAENLSQRSRADVRRARIEAEAALADEIVRAERLIDETLALLERLTAIEGTLERASLVGSTYKRRALVAMAAGRQRQADRAIELMSKHYAQAQAIGDRTKAGNTHYPAANRLVAEVALNAGRRNRWRLDGARLKVVRDSLASDDPGFWKTAGEIDLKLYDALAKRRLAPARGRLAKDYTDLYERVQSTRLWGSVYDTACLTLPAYAGRATKKEGEAARALLAQLRKYAHPAPA